MTETELRKTMVAKARSFIGFRIGSKHHKDIVDRFNQIKPDGWSMTYNAPWCATFASAIAMMVCGNSKAVKYFPLSANCGTIIEKAKKMGIWQEKDSYKPSIGDWILYDWDDNGVGDNHGSPDHVGIVALVDGGMIHVVEGNKHDAVGLRVLSLNGRWIRGFVTPNYGELSLAMSPKGIVIKDKAGLRAKPGKFNKLITRLSKNGTVTIIKSAKSPAKKTWYYVKTGSRYGYVYSKYIRKK